MKMADLINAACKVCDRTANDLFWPAFSQKITYQSWNMTDLFISVIK